MKTQVQTVKLNKDVKQTNRFWIFEKRGGKEKNDLINTLNEVFNEHKNRNKKS